MFSPLTLLRTTSSVDSLRLAHEFPITIPALYCLMGSCWSSSKVIVAGLPRASQLLYQPDCSLKVVRRNSISGEVLGAEKLKFKLKRPILEESHIVTVDGHEYWASYCVLPGQDPHDIYPKECQDLCFVVSDAQYVLLGLYDGHGMHGQEVVNFCSDTTKRYFRTRKTEMQNDPQRFLTEVTEKCDTDVKKPSSNIDVNQSGTTEVLVLIAKNKLTCASVGDSRAILASVNSNTDSPAPYANTDGEERKVLKSIKTTRQSIVNIPLYPIQLTKDQKPEDPEERERISKSGGTVSRITDPHGNKIGPYRVWKRNEGFPGLAMSRSIGDKTGSEVGIIATPVTTEYNLKPGQDLFIVAASDGVWDVMDNEDVINFVECYRGSCRKGELLDSLSITPTSCSIARLLCEEARVRWFSIVEDEDVMIDDISCVVIELEAPKNLHTYSVRHSKQQDSGTNPPFSIDSEEEMHYSVVNQRDPKRSSFIEGVSISPESKKRK
mmetsp:Transcript_16821/g.30067  ORF Transcript_16821/g.30067 Transcript_16821/m.30067 type:complete len:494 (+) Transcript_16821:5656-7137(+)